MKRIYNNSYLVISLYLLLGFLIDIMTNLTLNLSFSIGIILRGILFIYLVFGLFIKYPKKENYYILGLLGIFSLIFLIFKHTLTDITFLFKYNYVLVLFLFIYNLYKSEDKKINRNILTLSLIFYSLSIIIAWLTKSALNSYEVAKTGTVGWFNSANEISAIISIIVPYLFINLEKRINFIEIIAIILSLFAAILIGTRLPIVVFLICLLYILIKKLIKDIKRKKINYVNIILFIIFLIVFAIKFKETPLYKNMMIHINYLHLNNPIDVFTDFKLFDHFIFNRRLTFLFNINKIMIKSSMFEKLFGLNVISKTVEMDLFDLFYRYGLIGFTLFTFIFTYLIKKIRNKRRVNYLPISMIIMSSFLSGHVILSPNVSIITVIIISNLVYKKQKKKILLASYDLGVGGIESALVSFIKNINDDTNEITLYLEKKSGLLLNEIPKDVRVRSQKVFSTRFRLLNKMLNLLNKLKFLITNFKEYDCSFCYATYSLSSNFLARYASNNQAIYIHSDYTETYKNNITDINKFFGKRKLDKFKHIIFVSNESKDNFVALYPRFMDKIEVINNFIDNEKIIKLSDEKIKENKPKGKKLYVFVGRIDESSKNLTRLVNSFKLAYEKNKNIALWIIGSGPDFNYLKSLVSSNNLDKVISLMGQKKNPYPYMKKADYIILTSNYEGFPVIYGEAITLNKKIITTIDVSDETIKIPNNYGYICKKDENDIAKTMINVLEHDNLKYKKTNVDLINKNKKDLINKIINN